MKCHFLPFSNTRDCRHCGHGPWGLCSWLCLRFPLGAYLPIDRQACRVSLSSQPRGTCSPGTAPPSLVVASLTHRCLQLRAESFIPKLIPALQWAVRLLGSLSSASLTQAQGRGSSPTVNSDNHC